MSNDIYTAPESELLNEVDPKELVLASRWARLGASFVDALTIFLCFAVIGLVAFFVTGSDDPFGDAGVVVETLVVLAGYVLFLMLNYQCLSGSGQSWGKVLLKIKVVDLNGQKPEISRLLFVRYPIYLCLQLIPFIGGLASLVNILLIAGDEKLCGHDVLAGTKVVKC